MSDADDNYFIEGGWYNRDELMEIVTAAIKWIVAKPPDTSDIPEADEAWFENAKLRRPTK